MASTLLSSAVCAVTAAATSAFTHARALPASKLLLLASLLLNLKVLPLAWHFRFYRSLAQHWILRRRTAPGPRHLFAPVLTAARSPPYECDLNLHKSNSTYFADLDIARTHLMAALSKRSFFGRRARGDRGLYVALAGVTASFRKEIKPMRRYWISTRVLAWDRKWVFLVSHFVGEKGSAEGGGRRVYASCLSKYVFKEGRVTVPPEKVLRESGLIVGGTGEGFPGEGAVGKGGEEMAEEVRRLEEAVGPLPEEDAYWTPERVEAERCRGMEIARHFLELEALHAELREGDEEGLEHVGEFGMCA